MIYTKLQIKKHRPQRILLSCNWVRYVCTSSCDRPNG